MAARSCLIASFLPWPLSSLVLESQWVLAVACTALLLPPVLSPIDMGDAAPFKPYGVCPFEYKCAYGSNGTSQHGFACPDHARLHALIDHKVTFTQINKEKSRFKGEYEEGCCVTQRYFPPTLEDLKMIPLEQQQIIEYCDSELPRLSSCLLDLTFW